jgi:hypothetical protein
VPRRDEHTYGEHRPNGSQCFAVSPVPYSSSLSSFIVCVVLRGDFGAGVAVSSSGRRLE